MPIFAKETKTTDPRWKGRNIVIATDQSRDQIPVPDDVVLCNGCMANLVETESQTGYLIYLDKRAVKEDTPYDVYCKDCTKRVFPKAIILPDPRYEDLDIYLATKK